MGSSATVGGSLAEENGVSFGPRWPEPRGALPSAPTGQRPGWCPLARCALSGLSSAGARVARVKKRKPKIIDRRIDSFPPIRDYFSVFFFFSRGSPSLRGREGAPFSLREGAYWLREVVRPRVPASGGEVRRDVARTPDPRPLQGFAGKRDVPVGRKLP